MNWCVHARECRKSVTRPDRPTCLLAADELALLQKPGNVLINANCDCKVGLVWIFTALMCWCLGVAHYLPAVQICDFGMARARKPDDEEETVALWTDYVASRWYRAPELICCYLTRYTAAIDVWSIGCIASELLVRKALFPGKNGEQQLDLITDLVGAPSREDLQSLRSSRVKELLRTMRTKRPTDFRSFFPSEADDLELNLIREMLTFSADKRKSIRACQLILLGQTTDASNCLAL